MSDVLVLDHIARTYRQGGRELPVLTDASLTLKEGELVALVGPSGSGKIDAAGHRRAARTRRRAAPSPSAARTLPAPATRGAPACATAISASSTSSTTCCRS
ncbi:MAG: hypothetical protein WDN72_06085 [Alphaproteobacteria bacterium]